MVLSTYDVGLLQLFGFASSVSCQVRVACHDLS